MGAERGRGSDGGMYIYPFGVQTREPVNAGDYQVLTKIQPVRVREPCGFWMFRVSIQRTQKRKIARSRALYALSRMEEMNCTIRASSQ
jgi:hypothetical protein